jgi:hypothetical protein
VERAGKRGKGERGKGDWVVVSQGWPRWEEFERELKEDFDRRERR